MDYDYIIKKQNDLYLEIETLVQDELWSDLSEKLSEYINALSQENELLKQLSKQNLGASELNELEDLYKKLTDKYVGVYSIKAIKSIKEGKMKEAEKILKEGLKLDISSCDLNYNLAYLYQSMNNEQLKKRFYKKAYRVCGDKNIRESICRVFPEMNEFISERNDLKDINILHGTMEIANQMHTFVKGLKDRYLYARSLNYYDTYLKYGSDYTVDIEAYGNLNEANEYMKRHSVKYISEFDLFHFHFGTSLTLDRSDLRELKRLGKKVVMHHWGSDVRQYSIARKLSPYVEVKVKDEDAIKKELGLLSQYIDHCIVPDAEVYQYVKDYYKNVHILPVCIDMDKYKFVGVKKKKKGKTLIVHAPTSPEIKGTRHIIEAVEELKEKYDFEFKLVQGMSHQEAKKIYSRADIIIDQILVGQYGLFAVETMAMGKPVIANISDFMKGENPEDLPIISADPENIKEKIEMLINDKEMQIELGLKGRAYVEKYHDMKNVVEKLVEVYGLL